jgi:hypothetical protein
MGVYEIVQQRKSHFRKMLRHAAFSIEEGRKMLDDAIASAIYDRDEYNIDTPERDEHELFLSFLYTVDLEEELS